MTTRNFTITKKDLDVITDALSEYLESLSVHDNYAMLNEQEVLYTEKIESLNRILDRFQSPKRKYIKTKPKNEL